MSLSGARIRLDMPFSVGARCDLSVLGRAPISTEICWCAEGSIGLKFLVEGDIVRSIFSDRIQVLGIDAPL